MRIGRLLLLALLTALLVVVWVLWRNFPVVEEVSPAAGRLAPPDSELRLVFSHAMITPTLIDRLRTEPPREGAYRWEAETLVFVPDTPWPPGVTVTAHLEPGARSTWRLPLTTGHRWSFRVSRPELVYLWPADGPADLYALEPEEGEIRRLTHASQGILDFQTLADGSALFYSAVNASGGADLHRYDRYNQSTQRVLRCVEAVCQTPRPSPDGTLLAYQRGAALEEVRPTRLQLLRLNGDPAVETIATLSQPTRALSWSSDGRLAYYDAGQGAYQIYDPVSGERISLPNLTGEPGTWSPDGRAFVASEILLAPSGDTPSPEPLNPSHLLRYNLSGGETEDLSRGLNLEDADPVFSPTREALAFARRFLDAPRWALGRQLWLMNPDGSGPRPLTDDPAFHHTDFAWSPGGERLAYLRFNQTTLTDPPEIWLIDADGENAIRLLIGGYAPQWIP